jgi:catechol 2,3-dioxygenase-like lactoylglutathione lyase family enzyme
VIKGVHALFYTTDPEGARAFVRDKLGLPYNDVGDGWPIFDLPEGDVGFHPSDRAFHGISFYCDDLGAEMADLSERGVTCSPIVEEDGAA